jgi:hypothetical protein
LKDIGLAEVRPTEAPPVQPPAQPAALPSPPPELEPAPEPVKETYSVQFREGTKVGTKIFVLDERGHFVLDRIEYGTGATDAQAPAPPPGKKGAIKPANNSGPLK